MCLSKTSLFYITWGQSSFPNPSFWSDSFLRICFFFFHRHPKIHFSPLNLRSQISNAVLCFQPPLTSVLDVCFWESSFVLNRVASIFFCSPFINICLWPAGMKISIFAECIKHHAVLPFDPLCPLTAALNHLCISNLMLKGSQDS